MNTYRKHEQTTYNQVRQFVFRHGFMPGNLGLGDIFHATNPGLYHEG